MAMRRALLMVAIVWASPGLAQEDSGSALQSRSVEPQLELGQRNFTLPVIDYRAPDGTWKRGQGIIIGRDISSNATVGIGVFKIAPKHQDSTPSTLPTGGKSKKISLGLSLRF